MPIIKEFYQPRSAEEIVHFGVLKTFDRYLKRALETGFEPEIALSALTSSSCMQASAFCLLEMSKCTGFPDQFQFAGLVNSLVGEVEGGAFFLVHSSFLAITHSGEAFIGSPANYSMNNPELITEVKHVNKQKIPSALFDERFPFAHWPTLEEVEKILKNSKLMLPMVENIDEPNSLMVRTCAINSSNTGTRYIENYWTKVSINVG